MIKVNPQLEAHKSPAGTLIGKAEELFPALYRNGQRFKDIAIYWDEQHENIIVQTDIASERLIKTYIKNFLLHPDRWCRRLLPCRFRSLRQRHFCLHDRS